MKTFDQLSEPEQNFVISRTYSAIITDLAFRRIDFDSKTPKGSSANRILEILRLQAYKNHFGYSWLMLQISKRLKHYVYPLAIAASQERRYYGFKENKQNKELN